MGMREVVASVFWAVAVATGNAASCNTVPLPVPVPVPVPIPVPVMVTTPVPVPVSAPILAMTAPVSATEHLQQNMGKGYGSGARRRGEEELPDFEWDPATTQPSAATQQIGEVPHPDVIMEEQKRSVQQAKQNLAGAVQKMMNEAEEQKKGLADQAQQQMQNYAQFLEEQLQQQRQQIDAQLKARVDGATRTFEAYERRLEAQAQQSIMLYRAKTELEELKSARTDD